jgi:hypothetical protein
MYKIIGADQKEYEAANSDELLLWVKEGRADGRTLIKAEGTNEWKPLSSLPEFAQLTGAAGVPPRMPPFPGAPAGTFGVLEPDLNIGHCLGRAWELLKDNFGLLTAASFLIWLIDDFLHWIPFAESFFGGVFYGGLCVVFLKRIRGEPAPVREVFSGFRTMFVQLLLAGLLTSLLTLLAAFVFCFLIGLPGLYLKIAWVFALPLVIDKRLEFWSAMELSRKTVTRIWFKVFGLAVVAFAPFILVKTIVIFKTWLLMSAAMGPAMTQGAPDFSKLMQSAREVAGATVSLNLIAQVMLLLNLPFATGALMYAYEDLFCPRTPRSD